jgi:hypothetical protein
MHTVGTPFSVHRGAILVFPRSGWDTSMDIAAHHIEMTAIQQ